MHIPNLAAFVFLQYVRKPRLNPRFPRVKHFGMVAPLQVVTALKHARELTHCNGKAEAPGDDVAARTGLGTLCIVEIRGFLDVCNVLDTRTDKEDHDMKFFPPRHLPHVFFPRLQTYQPFPDLSISGNMSTIADIRVGERSSLPRACERLQRCCAIIRKDHAFDSSCRPPWP